MKLLIPSVFVLTVTVSLHLLTTFQAEQCHSGVQSQARPSYPEIAMNIMAHRQTKKLSHTRSTYAECRRPLTLLIVLLLLSGDVHANPGPSTQHPCGVCEGNVTWSRPAACCDQCSVWYHKSCMEMASDEYENIQPSHVIWLCCKCDTQNYNSSLFHSYELPLSNRYSSLRSVSTHSGMSNVSSNMTFSPPFTSSPHTGPARRRHSSTRTEESPSSINSSSTLPPRNPTTWRTLVVNCQSLRGKAATLETATSYVNPDAIIGTESWLDSSVSSSEVFPAGYEVHRNDRNLDGGGVFVAVKTCYASHQIETDCAELTWAQVALQGGEKLNIGSYHRLPHEVTTDLDNLTASLDTLSRSMATQNVVLGGDFNAPEIDWNGPFVKPGATRPTLHQKLLDVANDNILTQVQMDPTRGPNVLDLFFTNKPSLVRNVQVIPGISDHEMVVVDADIKAQTTKSVPRKCYKYSRADWDQLQTGAETLCQEILANFDQQSVNENWVRFRDGLLTLLEKHVPSKLSSTRHNVPWFTASLKRATRKKQKLFSKAKRTGNATDWEAYRTQKKNTLRALRRAHTQYIESVLQAGLDQGDTKPFWRYIKSRRQDNTGVAPIKDKGQIHSDNITKANLLNRQFESVFTPPTPREDQTLPTMPGDPYPPCDNITVSEDGVRKLLGNIKVNKAGGPDGLPNRLLKAIAPQITPVLTRIFNQSLSTGCLPLDWQSANISPVFKKGARSEAANYRPVSLTCVCCKLLEHIVCSHIMTHFDRHSILTPTQHGFRRGHSCESQLLITTDDITRAYDNKVQTDVMILDFSKAFDTVPHNKLLYKLDHYGVRGTTHSWISAFLGDCTQRVVVGGEFSSAANVVSGVPQGTVLGPLLFLCHINDLPLAVNSTVRLFADDCLLYRTVKTISDQVALQRDLDSLQKWSVTWGMRFNPKKCYVLQVARTTTSRLYHYSLGGQVLSQVEQNPYLGVLIHNKMSWSPHIESIVSKANSTVGFLRRNLKHCRFKLRVTGYISLVRPKLEYCSSVWDPHFQKDVLALEMVQRRAARFVYNDYSRQSSVTDMLNELQWPSLQHRRMISRLVLLYKVVNSLVAVPYDLRRGSTRTRSQNSQKFMNIGTKTDAYKYSFYPRTVKEWNLLPFTPEGTLDAFKQQAGAVLLH